MPISYIEIYTLSDLSVWFFAEKGFLSIDSETTNTLQTNTHEK